MSSVYPAVATRDAAAGRGVDAELSYVVIDPVCDWSATVVDARSSLRRMRGCVVAA